MINFLYKKDDLRYLFLYGDNNELELLEKYLNKIPSYMFLPNYNGIVTPEIFLNKFRSKHNKIIYWCHSGLYITIIEFLKSKNIQYSGIDNYFKYTNFVKSYKEFENYIKDWKLNITPRDYQIKAAWLILHYRQSLSQLATRAGKTLIAYIVFRYLLENGCKNILMIVPSILLVKQGVEDMSQYKEFFKTDTVWAKSDICSSSNLTIGTFQSLIKFLNKSSKKYNPTFFDKFDVVLIDEAHRIPCKSIKTILNQPFLKNIKLKFGFSGTLPENNTIEFLSSHSLMGPTIQNLTSYELINNGILAKPLITQIYLNYNENDRLVQNYIKCGEYLNSSYIYDGNKKRLLPKSQQFCLVKYEKKLPYALKEIKKQNDINKYYNYLINLCKYKGTNLLILEQMLTHLYEERLNIICDILKNINKNTIIFAHHTEYIKIIKNYIQNKFPDRNIYIITRSNTLKSRQKIIKNLEVENNSILCASYGCCSTGITFKNIDYGIFAQSFKSKYVNNQSIGRLMMKTNEKDKFYLFDLIDNFPTKKIYEQGLNKKNLYKKEKFNFIIKNITI